VKRGEIWTAAAGGPYTAKPRSAVIIQSDLFDATDSITVCAFTTDPTDAPLIRIPIDPAPLNGLDQPSALMVDEVATVPRSRLGVQLGRLSDEDMVRLERSLVVFLGLA
jgi:mRNA interferase MazF